VICAIVWVNDSVGPKKVYVLDRSRVLGGAQIPHAKGQLLERKHMPGHADDTLP